MVDKGKSDKRVSCEKKLYEFSKVCSSINFELSIQDFFATPQRDYDCYVDTASNK